MSDVRRPAGAIHDIGYRRYGGARLGHGEIARALYVASLRHAFGLGRSGRSKILPFTLVALNLFPALIIVGVMTFLGLDILPLGYAPYALTTSVLTAIYAASLGPVLLSNDLRHGTISLYLARPLSATGYVLARWGAIVTAIFAFLMAPVLVMYVGTLLASLDVVDQTADLARAVVSIALLAAMLGSTAALFGAFAVRRGFAIVGTIGVVLFGYAVLSVVQSVAVFEADAPRVGEVAGLLSPMSLYAGDVDVISGLDQAIAAPTGPAMSAAYVAVSLLVVVGALAVLVSRYRRVATR
ncbi:MAG: hypothetical protein WBP61_03615 [Nocardioides sp.]